MRLRLFVSFSVAVLVAAAAGTANAQQLAAAQELFLQGKKLLKAGKVEQACAKFKAAATLSKTPGVRLNLAGCWLKLGRTASAWAMYNQALSLAEQQGNRAAAKFAQHQRTELAPKLSYLEIDVPDPVKGLKLTRDGQVVPRAEWGFAVPTDPGPHSVTASAPGHKPWSAQRTVAGDGARAKIVVPSLASVPRAAPRPAASPPQPWSGTAQRTLAVVSAGLGVVGLGLGSYFGLRAMSKKHDYQSQLDAAGQCADAACSSTSHDAYVAGNVSTVAFAAGGVLLGAGAVLWLTAPHPRHARTGVSPMLGPSVAGVSLDGSF